jgi:ABC-type sugar transport system substrate-binding protein
MTRLLTVLLAALLAASPAAASSPEKKKGGGSTFVALPPTAANVVQPSGRMGIVTVETSLDVHDPELHARAQASTPRLRAAYAAALQSHVRGLGAGAAPNADRLSGELQRATDRVLGKPGAKLLLGSIILN